MPSLLLVVLLGDWAATACYVHTDMKGPFHMAGAPFRDGGAICVPHPDQTDERRVNVSGRILAAGCGGVVGNATIDVWQASGEPDSRYYECPQCPDKQPPFDTTFFCRGRVLADGEGRFMFSTTVPGRYSARPILHLHVAVTPSEGAPAEHVTQLYFTEDDSSSSYNSAVRMTMSEDGVVAEATLDIATPFDVTASLLESSTTEVPTTSTTSATASPTESASTSQTTSSTSTATNPTATVTSTCATKAAVAAGVAPSSGAAPESTVTPATEASATSAPVVGDAIAATTTTSESDISGATAWESGVAAFYSLAALRVGLFSWL